MNPFFMAKRGEPSPLSSRNGSSCLVLKMKIFLFYLWARDSPFAIEKHRERRNYIRRNPCKPFGKHIALYMIQEYRSVTIFSSSLSVVTYIRRHQPSAYITWSSGGKERLTRNRVLQRGNSIAGAQRLRRAIMGGKNERDIHINCSFDGKYLQNGSLSWKKQLKRWKIAFCRAINLFCLPYTLRCVFSIYAARVLSRSESKQNERYLRRIRPVFTDLSRESCKKSIKGRAGVDFRESASDEWSTTR